MVNYAVLPPEVNSARMYSGAGSSPMLTAAASWDRLAATLSSAATSYQTVVSQLTDGSWRGPSSAAMAASAQPYVQWMSTTAAQASQAAGQARAAAAAYESAFAATVPPGVVEANRAQLQVLLANNVIGQNAGAIAANQAEYGQMWAQDAAAMHGYAASSAGATGALSPFSPAPQTSNPAGQAQAQAQSGINAGAQAANPIMDFLNNNPLEALVNSPLVTGLEGLYASQQGSITAMFTPGFTVSSNMLGGATFPAMAAVAATMLYGGLTGAVPAYAMSDVSGGESSQYVLASAHPSTAGAANAMRPGFDVTANAGRGASIGKLSVPLSWSTAATSDMRLAAAHLPLSTSAGLAGAPAAGMAPRSGMFAGMPPVAGLLNSPATGAAAAQPGEGAKLVSALGTPTDRQSQTRQPGHGAAGARRKSSARTELERLRQAAAELTEEREMIERLSDSLLREAGVHSEPVRRSR